jgi:predicted nucleic acid-binding protein
MITAIDTNILLDILLPSPSFYGTSLDALERFSQAGSLVICEIVYAELSIHFAERVICDRFLDENDIQVDFLNRPALFAASRAFRKYRLAGGKRERILPDSLIGAHAHIQASRLVSRDRGFYRSLFPTLSVVNPARI